MEHLQPSGSFKTRGIGFACQKYFESGRKNFVSSSGGNAGLAVAYSGRRLGAAVKVVVPESTSTRAIKLIKQESAEVVVHGSSWQEAHNHALSILDEGSAYLHPFDDPMIWQGHSSIVDEVVETEIAIDAIVLSVGGGGLLCGVAHGLSRHQLVDVPIYTSETIGAESFYKSVEANHLIELDQITSIATSLGAKKIAVRALEVAHEHPVKPYTVSDTEAVEACLRFTDDHRIITEPACGASLALAYKGIEALRKHKNVLIIVCGGTSVTYEKLIEFKKKCA